MHGAPVHIETDSPYLTKQIIAYIGNKRKLLSLIYAALETSGLDLTAPLRFADLFSGSGVVSRFAKELGFEVWCNDWEPYAEVLSRGFVETDKSELEALFADEGGLSTVLSRINALPAPSPESGDRYISRYYSAQHDDTDAADFRTERLFYTRRNGLALDTIRSHIEHAYPDPADKRRQVLLALLLYEAATHTNTSGVFKAFHKGFGGHGKDALTRILAPIALHEPVLIDGMAPVHVFRRDANVLARDLPPLDVVYLDPPYNQHQYGSNYHILNTIALWDKIPAPLKLDEHGVLKSKAAIRADWTKTRSPYCYKKTAAAAFRDLVSHIRARLILVSYSSDGIIPFGEMKDICLSKGYVSIVTSGYTVYRGGKQSNSRKSADIEFVLAIDTTRAADAGCSEQIDRVIAERRLHLLLKRRYSRESIAALTGGASTTAASGADSFFVSPDGLTLALRDETATSALPTAEIASLALRLERAVCQTKAEELSALVELALTAPADIPPAPGARTARTTQAARAVRQLPATLKKLAQKKYRAEFYTALSDIHRIRDAAPELYALIDAKIADIRRTAELRFQS